MPDHIDDRSQAILDDLTDQYEGDTPPKARIKIANEIAPELGRAVGMVSDISDHKLEALSHAQLINLVKDMRNEARAVIPPVTTIGAYQHPKKPTGGMGM